MKRMFLTAILLFFTAVMSGCDGTGQGGTSDAAYDGPTGTVSVTLPDLPARNIDLTTAIANTTVYEILVYNASCNTSMVVDSDGVHDLIVPTGTYKVLVLAGNNESYQNYPVLLGTGLSSEITVVENTVTDVTVTLGSISHNFNVPSIAECGSSFDVTVEGDFGVPVLSVSSIAISENGNYKISYPTASGQTWNETKTHTALPSEGIIEFKIISISIILKDSDYGITGYLSDTMTLYWYWLCSDHISNSNTALQNEVVKTVTCVAPATPMGVQVTVEWETE